MNLSNLTALLFLLSQTPEEFTFDPSDSTIYYIEQEVSDIPHINVNTASYQDLVKLPYISNELARTIVIEARRKPFKDFTALASRIKLTPVEFFVLKRVLVYETRPPPIDFKGFLKNQVDWDRDISLKFWTIGRVYDKLLLGFRFPERQWTVGYRTKLWGIYTGFLEPQFGLGLLFPNSYRYYPRLKPSERFKLLRGEEPGLGLNFGNGQGILLWVSREKDYAIRLHSKHLGLNITTKGITFDLSKKFGNFWIANEYGSVGTSKFKFLTVLRSHTDFGTFRMGITNAGVLGAQLTFSPLDLLDLTLSQTLYSGYSYRRQSLGIHYGSLRQGITLRYYSSGKLPGPYRTTYSIRLSWKSTELQQSVMLIRTVKGETHGTGILMDVIWGEVFLHGVVYRALDWDSRLYLYDPSIGPTTYSKMFYGSGSEISLGIVKRTQTFRWMLKGVYENKDNAPDGKLVIFLYKT